MYMSSYTEFLQFYELGVIISPFQQKGSWN